MFGWFALPWISLGNQEEGKGDKFGGVWLLTKDTVCKQGLANRIPHNVEKKSVS